MVISAWAESEVTPLPDWYEVWLHTALRKTYSGCWKKWSTNIRIYVAVTH